MNKIIISVSIFLSCLNLSGQTFEDFIDKVKLSHPEIIAARTLLSSDEALSKTGNTPDDPRINMGYFPGNDAAPGDKITWGISQSFDFPGMYSRIKTLKESKLELAKMEYSLACVYIMSEARSAAIEYLSLLETLEIQQERMETMNRLEKAYSILLDKGEASIIDYNKIRIKQVEYISELTSTSNRLDILKTRLDYMSGDNSEDLLNSDYPLISEPALPVLLEGLRSVHPAFLLPDLRTQAARNEIRVSKAGNMPSFDIGFSSEIVADETFTGPSLGLSLPLWKNKGQVNKSLAVAEYQSKKAESEKLYQESVYMAYYRSYQSNKENLAIVEDALENSDNRKLIDKTLDKREISLREYLIELGSIYELVDIYQALKKEKYILLSKLNELDFSDL